MKPIPGPTGHWLLGSASEFQADRLGFLRRCQKAYGDLFAMRVATIRCVVVNDLGAIRRILIDDAAKYQKSRLTRDIFGRVMGNGLLVAEGNSHRRQRRLAQPAFDAKRLRAYGEVAVRHAEAAVSRWMDASTIDVSAEMSRITMNVAAESLFGSALDADTGRLAAAMDELQDAAGTLFNSGFVAPAWLPTRKNRMLRRATAVVDAVLDEVIAERRRNLIDRGDLLSMLLMARDDDGAPMSAAQVRDEAVTLFLAGFETTANALTWVWYHLAKNPDVAARLEREVRSQPAPLAPDLEALPYVSMVLKESLRLSCPVWAFNRSPIVPESLGDHAIMPKDVVIISPYLLHRNDTIFPEPERFDPERFAPHREAEIPRLSFLPFGAGQRVCIGARLAMLEAGLVIATIASRIRLTLPEDHKVEPEVQLSIRPKGGLVMQIDKAAVSA